LSGSPVLSPQCDLSVDHQYAIEALVEPHDAQIETVDESAPGEAIGYQSAAVWDLDRITVKNGQKLFLSGSNVAWCPHVPEFGSDMNHLLESNIRTWFEDMIDEVSDAGGNSLRWWIHPDGSPLKYNNYVDRMVTGITPQQIDNIRWVLDYALDKEVTINLCLWSFDMVNDGGWGAKYGRYNVILTDADHLNAYTDNFLRPLVREFADHPALLSFEVCNEPEGMSSEGTSGPWGWSNPADQRVDIATLQRFHNWVASAIHDEAPDALVTTGAWSFESNRETGGTSLGEINVWSDDRLISAGGKANGTLDYYQVHYYSHFGSEFNPFVHHASEWNLDKPIVIGEMEVSLTANSYVALYDNGYAGAWAWRYAPGNTQNWDDIEPTVRELFDLHPCDIQWRPEPAPNNVTAIRFEAERATLLGGAPVDNSFSGYSGSGYVYMGGNVGRGVQWSVNVPSAGQYDVEIGYSSWGRKINSLYVNASRVGGVTFQESDGDPNTWETLVLTVELNAGDNTVAIMKASSNDWGYVNLDYLRVLSELNVVGRHVFYNNSKFDGNDPTANSADDLAIDTDKKALLPGETPSEANRTGYSRGINGVMIDIDNPLQTPTPDDFAFTVNESGDPDNWTAAPVPAMTVRPGDGVGGSDRVTLIWADGAVENRWLKVTVLSDANGGSLGLGVNDVFYFGNLVGDIDGDGEVGGGDYGTVVRELGHRCGGVGTLASDLNADGRVNMSDFAIVRGARGNSAPAPMVAAPAPQPPAVISPELQVTAEPVTRLAAVEETVPVSGAAFELVSVTDAFESSTPAAPRRGDIGGYDGRRLHGDELAGSDDGKGDGLQIPLQTGRLLVDILNESALAKPL